MHAWCTDHGAVMVTAPGPVQTCNGHVIEVASRQTQELSKRLSYSHDGCCRLGGTLVWRQAFLACTLLLLSSSMKSSSEAE